MMVASLRDTFVVGPLIALLLVPGAAMIGTAIAVGRSDLTAQAAGRVAIEMGMVVVAGLAVFLWKQRRFHRRSPLM